MPAIANKSESYTPTLADSLQLWLSITERLPVAYNKLQVAELAGGRGIVVAAERGICESPFTIDSKTPIRKVATTIAVF